jgi:uncharacterized damage-inducible protein DinB
LARGDYIIEKKVERSKSDSIEYEKKEIQQMLAAAFDTVSSRVSKVKPGNFPETVDFFAGEKSKLQILNLMQDHVSHHRGQIIVYLNLKGIEPPRYVGW